MRGQDTRSEEAKAYRRLYKTARWKRTRQRQLFIEPTCRMCKADGRLTIASVCDHIDPDKKRDPATFFEGPFQSLCDEHHSGTKQQIEKRGYSSAVDESGWPTCPNHPSNLATKRVD